MLHLRFESFRALNRMQTHRQLVLRRTNRSRLLPQFQLRPHAIHRPVPRPVFSVRPPPRPHSRSISWWDLQMCLDSHRCLSTKCDGAEVERRMHAQAIRRRRESNATATALDCVDDSIARRLGPSRIALGSKAVWARQLQLHCVLHAASASCGAIARIATASLAFGPHALHRSNRECGELNCRGDFRPLVQWTPNLRQRHQIEIAQKVLRTAESCRKAPESGQRSKLEARMHQRQD